jgi:quercetin dioxygenase-like cupin family protein
VQPHPAEPEEFIVSKTATAPRKRASAPAAAAATKTEGAVRAGNGRYTFRMSKLRRVEAGTGYSTSSGGVVEGARMLVGMIDKPQGTGSRMHSHANEQFNYVVKGTLRGSINGKRVTAPAGTLIYIPANAPHTLVAKPGEDVIFMAIKDLSQGIIGRAVDGTMSGPLYMKGYGPSAARKPARPRAAKTARRGAKAKR